MLNGHLKIEISRRFHKGFQFCGPSVSVPPTAHPCFSDRADVKTEGVAVFRLGFGYTSR